MLVRGMGIELVGDTLAKLLAPGGRQAAGGKRSSHRYSMLMNLRNLGGSLWGMTLIKDLHSWSGGALKSRM
jgi:hypothetical protein